MTTLPTDPHSYSNPNQVRVTHLFWKASVRFETKTIEAVATWQLEVSSTDKLILDTKALAIRKILVDDREVSFQWGSQDTLLGQPLYIPVTSATKTVSIHYCTSSEAEALQWLSPNQTADRQNPFLFTQSQAILARSWVPCQDSPGVRFTYDAEVTVPTQLLPLMSACNPQSKNHTGMYRFEMRQPIPSYLLALAVGDVSFKAVSERCGIYAESSMLNKAAWEFADLEKMVTTAEELYGCYAWERYDVIVLPPSFPFGGMENPRLTFATPTILAGDRSLTSLIAHELAHSWSGNLVTNATWNDFWLNEGFTVYFEHRIMENLYGRDYSEMLAFLALQELRKTIEELTNTGKADDTKLRLNLKDRNPDDGVTDIAYNKGYYFLRSIEEKFGKDKFDAFLIRYFSDNQFKAMDTDGFVMYIKTYYQSTHSVLIEDSFLSKWIHTIGLPDDCPAPNSTLFAKVDTLLQAWLKTGELNREVTLAWSTHEWLHFINNIPLSISLQQLSALDAQVGLTQCGNAEILCAWLVHAIRHNYAPAYTVLEHFLITTGRRKFLSPLYGELIKTKEGKERAKAIYSKARPNYHFVATNNFDNLLGKD